MTYILIAICSIVFYGALMPIIDNFASFVQSAMNKKIHSWQMEMNYNEAKLQAEIENLSPPQTSTNAIGFITSTEQNCDCCVDKN